MEQVNSTENLRDRIQEGYLYTMLTPDGNRTFGGSITAKKYYDAQILNGDIPEDIIETILQHRDETPIKLSQLIKTSI